MNKPVISLEGNGQRPSHKGDGYHEDKDMYTLNTTEVHAVCYAFEPGIAKRQGNPCRFVQNITPTIRADAGDNRVAVCYGIGSYGSNAWKSGNLCEQPSRRHNNAGCAEQHARCRKAYCMGNGQSGGDDNG